MWARKILNDEAQILDAIGQAMQLGEEVSWAVNIHGSPAGLLLALLAAHGQQPHYVPGRTVNAMAVGYRGEAQIDAKDAYVIAEASPLRRDFTRSRSTRSSSPN